jgi:hypothetical protein
MILPHLLPRYVMQRFKRTKQWTVTQWALHLVLYLQLWGGHLEMHVMRWPEKVEQGITYMYWQSVGQSRDKLYNFLFANKHYSCVRFEVRTATSMKMAAVWAVAPCSSLLTDVFIESSIRLMSDYPDDGGSKLLWNVGHHLPDYTVQHPRQSSSSTATVLLCMVSYEVRVHRRTRLFGKIWKNVNREKLLKIMCFQSQMFEFCT